jgi:dihydroorotate dehydrogenase
LAGGIDKTGERAGELLGLGFGSVEFGSVTVAPLAGSNPGLSALLERIAIPQGYFLRGAVHREKQPKTAIGIGLGLPLDLPSTQLAAEWLAGLCLLAKAPAVADYLSLNLSAAANRRFVGVELRSILLDALAAVADFRSGQEANQRPFLALKLPVDAAPGLWPALVAAGFDQLTVVLPDGAGRLESLARVATLAASGEGPVLVAVGGIRDAVGRQAVCAAGAREVQVHRLFAEAGVATLDRLLAAD